jgi:hypothetical protein
MTFKLLQRDFIQIHKSHSNAMFQWYKVLNCIVTYSSIYSPALKCWDNKIFIYTREMRSNTDNCLAIIASNFWKISVMLL